MDKQRSHCVAHCFAEGHLGNLGRPSGPFSFEDHFYGFSACRFRLIIFSVIGFVTRGLAWFIERVHVFVPMALYTP